MKAAKPLLCERSYLTPSKLGSSIPHTKCRDRCDESILREYTKRFAPFSKTKKTVVTNSALQTPMVN